MCIRDRSSLLRFPNIYNINGQRLKRLFNAVLMFFQCSNGFERKTLYSVVSRLYNIVSTSLTFERRQKDGMCRSIFCWISLHSWCLCKIYLIETFLLTILQSNFYFLFIMFTSQSCFFMLFIRTNPFNGQKLTIC